MITLLPARPKMYVIAYIPYIQNGLINLFTLNLMAPVSRCVPVYTHSSKPHHLEYLVSPQHDVNE